MTKASNQELSLEGVEQLPLHNFAQDAYLNYSMSVIRDRALPSVTDGMKPVQRRIIYAMAKLGINSKSKHVKSARTVGEVLGKYHPHGDRACYEAMVLMAQPFTYRYPLIDGQGNWGDIEDPKSFAAMRYTEARLSENADLLLEELNLGCVDWQQNFDGTVDEPKALPSRIPNILLNGTMGIAVGMATDIPPHNLNELIKATIYLLDHDNASVEKLMSFVQGPDYPCGADIITPKDELLKIYQTGRGTIRMRAVYENTKDGIVISALPYQVGVGQIEKELAELLSKKKLPWISNLINASDHNNPCRLIIVPRSNRIDVDSLMSHLFATTDLECTYRVNLNILGLDGKPQVKDLKTILTEWLTYRIETVKKRINHRLTAVNKRLHVLDGLLKVFLNIDEVIQIIRTEDNCKEILMQRFNLSEIQVEHILETKLRQLARLEEEKIEAEQRKLGQEKNDLEHLLADPNALKTEIKAELRADAKKYGDERRCAIVTRNAAQEISFESMVPSQTMSVILSKMGWVRAASGANIDPLSLTYKQGDSFLGQAIGKSNQYAVFISNLGRSFATLIKELPSARGAGEPISTRFSMQSNEFISCVLTGEENDYFLLASDHNYGFICRFADMITRNKSGKALMTLDPDAVLLPPVRIKNPEQSIIMAVSKQGRLIAYRASEIKVLPRGKGLKLMKISANNINIGLDAIAEVVALNEGDSITLVGQNDNTFNLSAQKILENLGSRERTGESLPKKLQRLQYIEVHVAQEQNDNEQAKKNEAEPNLTEPSTELTDKVESIDILEEDFSESKEEDPTQAEFKFEE